MEYDIAKNLVNDNKFCDLIKSPNLSYDLTVLKEEVLPALTKRIADLEEALQKQSDTLFKKDNSYTFDI